MKAIILSGGKGERLRPFTNECPKGMVQIEGKPILEYQIEWLKKYGVKEVIFACGYLSEKIKEYFEDGKKFGIRCHYSIEDEPLGRGGALKKAWQYIKDDKEPVIATNGDIYTELDLREMISLHKSTKDILVTMCLIPYKSPYGVVRIGDDGLVMGFDEKRKLPYWINGGVYIFNHEVVNHLPEKGDHETLTFPDLAKRKLLQGYKSNAYWRSIETVKDLNEVAREKIILKA